MVAPKVVAESIETRIAALDTTLFDDIPSQTDIDDRRSLLAIQAAIAQRQNPFAYLEIGSHLGGSIQPYLRDNRCSGIISVDKRPPKQPDERGREYLYRDNSTERMLENLKRLAQEDVCKVRTFDADAIDLDQSELPFKPNLCFIDGEHTNTAVETDFAFCISAMRDSGVICFHDSNIIFQALATIVDRLKRTGRRFHAYNLPRAVFVIDLGMDIHEDDRIRKLLLENHLGYLSALESMVCYRDFHNKWFARKLREVYEMKPLRAVARAMRSAAKR